LEGNDGEEQQTAGEGEVVKRKEKEKQETTIG
jgi:hypothetical protein